MAQQLNRLVRDSAKSLLSLTLEAEVREYLGRSRNKRRGPLRGGRGGYRNGTTRRKFTVGKSVIEIRVPRISNLPEGQEPFASALIQRYRHIALRVGDCFDEHFRRALVSADFTNALTALLGDAPNFPTGVFRQVQSDSRKPFQSMLRPDLGGQEWRSMYAGWAAFDGETHSGDPCLLMLVGKDAGNRSSHCAISGGRPEDVNVWRTTLRDCCDRGMSEPQRWVGDGSLGLWAALDERREPSSRESRAPQ